MKEYPPKSQIKYCCLKDLELYFDQGCYYLKATYQIEDLSGVYELVIPKIRTGFGTSILPEIEEEKPFPMRHPKCCWLKTGGQTMSILQDENSAFYNLKLLEKRVVEMTIKEIEEKLGHGIKIIKEK